MHRSIPRLSLLLGVTLLAAHVVVGATGVGGHAFRAAFAQWFQPAVYFGAGAATLAAAALRPEARRPWLLLGVGLVLYGSGSVYYNLAYGDVAAPPFPSPADALWLCLYPMVLAAVAVLARGRFGRLSRTIWIDGVIGGTVVAALAAAVFLQPVFDLTVDDGAAAVARLAYPVGDLLSLGVVVVMWNIGGRGFDRVWTTLGAAFAILALGDAAYVVEAAHGEWVPGGTLDLPCSIATMLMATAAWSRAEPARGGETCMPLPLLPALFALLAVGLTTYGVIEQLNPVAVTLTVATLFAVVVRFGVTLASLTRQRDALSAQATTDPLTGLANHRALHERLVQELGRARRDGEPLSVVVFDIDHFKAVNDTYGHAEGDRVLMAVAGTLSRHARPYDTAGRIGGEEFALVLPGVDAGQAFEIAERCRVALGDVHVQGAAVSCSAGVAAFPDDDADGGRLLELADGALYWAKRSGRAQVRRYDPREVVLLSSAEQHEEVRALLARQDAITPVFQPIVELATGRVAGYEALSRFPGTRPVRAPELWFAQARRCGLAGALEARAIQAALAVPGRPAGTFLSLNVSAAALVSGEVGRVLPEDVSGLVLEVSEDAQSFQDAQLGLELERLRARGARIALDDVGTGYAGLQEVIRLKPEILKLDRSLVQGLHHDASRIALIEALSRFAVSTDVAVCAKGIEDPDDLRTLADFDVTYGQGFALGHPEAAWTLVAAPAAAEAAGEVRHGMRVTPRPTADRVTIGAITDALARTRTRDDLWAAMELIRRLVNADDVALSRVDLAGRYVQTLTEHHWGPVGERFDFDDYPTTTHVVAGQVIGQVVAGDPAADPAELEVLRRDGFGSVLLAPIVLRAQTIGLLEVYRRTPRPWSPTEIDEARLLAHHLGAALEIADERLDPDRAASAVG